MNEFRVIPSIEQLRQTDVVRQLEEKFGHGITVIGLREETRLLRDNLKQIPDFVEDSNAATQHIEKNLEKRLQRLITPTLQPVINATGIIVHTNLGRAPLATTACNRIQEIASGYSNLEYDITRGTRGSRSLHAADLLETLTGAEAAVVVNNNAAAVLLLLAALASGREVIISRGELVEIGGGFRIPDVLRQSGASLREVGTTNRTNVNDYAAAINDKTALILRVHPSNFKITGFSDRPSLPQLVATANRFGIPVVEDLGSGSLKSIPALEGEPTVHDSIEAGVSACTFSGDKLLGGPQAGIIVGHRSAIDLLTAHPLMRALRVDKLTYAALEATLIEYIAGRSAGTIPVHRMLETTTDLLAKRANQIISQLDQFERLNVKIVSSQAAVGGGSTPGLSLPSLALSIKMTAVSSSNLFDRLRSATPPVVGRIANDQLLLDLTTILPEQDLVLAKVLFEIANSETPPHHAL